MTGDQLELFDRPPGLSRPPSLPAGTRWHEIALPGGPLGFMLRRSQRRTIGLVIRDDGLMVQAPRWSTLTQIEQAVRSKAAWIQDKLEERERHLALLALQSAQWRAGGRIPYLGVPVQLRLDGRHDTHFAGVPEAPRAGDVLSLALPADADAERVREAASVWLQQRARLDFEQRLDRFLARAGCTITGWRLSSATGRWGSCNSAGRIMLNWRLIHFDPVLIDYVVAHEVAHLREMNHSPAFWAVLAGLYPAWQSARQALAQHRPGGLPPM